MAGSLDSSTMTGSTWVKSSLSFANGNCVEVSDQPGGTIGVRNSREREGPVLRFTPDEWQAFLGGVRNGEFDDFGRTPMEARGAAPQGGVAVPRHERPPPPSQPGGDGQALRAVGYPMTSVSLSS